MQIMVGLRHGTIFLLRIIVIRRAWVGAQSGFGMMTRLPPAAVSRGIPTKTWKSSLMRSEEHTSELQSLMHISYAVFCLKNKHINNPRSNNTDYHTHKPTYDTTAIYLYHT